MKWIVLTSLFLTSLQTYAQQSQDQLLKEFHKFGIRIAMSPLPKIPKPLALGSFLCINTLAGLMDQVLRSR